MDNEPFSNPLAPPSAISSKNVQNQVINQERSQPMTNDDFRKLMMTPRNVQSGQSSSASIRGSVRNKHGSGNKSKSEQNENLKKKKKIYEMIRKKDGDVLTELAKKYRDRAKERRDGSNVDAVKNSEFLINSTAYHAVGPNNFDMDAAERRKQLIQESKYLGGDIEHTHLVKGLDYALLQKIKAEIEAQEEEKAFLEEQQQKEDEEKLRQEEKQRKMRKHSKNDASFDDQDRYAIKSEKAANLLKIIFNKNLPQRNELFRQGRMAYQYDLTNDFPENDISTTIIRSKAECPNLDSLSSMSTNEIILNKLIQIWSQIRSGSSKKQKRKYDSSISDEKFSTSTPKEKMKSEYDSIYDDIGDYVPDIKSKRTSSSFCDNIQNGKRKSYFETASTTTKNEDSEHKTAASEMAATIVENLPTKINKKSKIPKQTEPDSYAECYPGYAENDDAIIDTDDDDDDNEIGSNKVKDRKQMRSNYNDNDDYEDEDNRNKKEKYRSSGDKTMTTQRMKNNEKAKLDRQYQKINALINKKKQSGEKIGMSYLSSS